jgi:putative glutamine amidotransferase
VPGTRYAEIVPEETQVPSYHHQAVDRLGDRLTVSAYAEDGMIEALELPGEPWVLGVQWHPEMATDTRLAEALVAAASPPAVGSFPVPAAGRT